MPPVNKSGNYKAKSPPTALEMYPQGIQIRCCMSDSTSPFFPSIKAPGEFSGTTFYLKNGFLQKENNGMGLRRHKYLLTVRGRPPNIFLLRLYFNSFDTYS